MIVFYREKLFRVYINGFSLFFSFFFVVDNFKWFGFTRKNKIKEHMHYALNSKKKEFKKESKRQHDLFKLKFIDLYIVKNYHFKLDFRRFRCITPDACVKKFKREEKKKNIKAIVFNTFSYHSRS